MIASIQGMVAATGKDYAVVTTGGIGYKVFVPFHTLERLHSENEAYLHTTLIVREDSLTLYGFATTTERDVFDILISISGIGPKTGLAIMSTLTLDSLRNAVVAERAEILTRVPGIGNKSAQKILIELKDKLKLGMDTAPVSTFDDVNSDVLDTLVALGYSIVEAQTAIQSLPKNAPQDVEERVRLALSYFA
ncbi:MAG: Holliday junction branch migration protein RuvA [Chloroflexi bacterium]|nr:Holliday junction branch migration protein RuvA [Chloroflexota bacterium]MCC6891204.1 Holliday junction branch migration protein RuvA [Anaerolineae bacterium]